MEPWQRGGGSKFSGIQEQKQSGIKLQSWQREPGKFSAENAWYALKKDVVEEKFKVCLADWQKANKHDDTTSKDTFTLVIGNEVNLYDKVYANNVYHMGESDQVGHSFYYVTKNGVIYSAFSFGPKNHIYGQIGSNAGTVDYEIGQVFRFHRFSITREQAIQIKKQVDIFRGKVDIPPTRYRTYKHLPIQIKPIYSPNAMLYAPIGNYTCAAMAIDTLNKAGISTPNGKGKIDLSGDKVEQGIILASMLGLGVGNTLYMVEKGILPKESPIEVVNPYEWYHNIVQKYGEGELYQGANPKKGIKSDGFSFVDKMFIIEGESDPLVNTGQTKKVLHLR